MSIQKVHLLHLLVALGHIFTTDAVCQGTVNQLNDVTRRSPSYVAKESEAFVKDTTLLGGWYSAQDGHIQYVIAESNPGVGHCGTYYPVYLKGALPKSYTDGNEYDYTACLVGLHDACQQQYPVKVRMCGGQLQMYLSATDGESAYCLERTNITDVAPAPRYNVTGGIVVRPAMRYTTIGTLKIPELEFKCSFSANDAYLYKISWFVNGLNEYSSPRVKLQHISHTNLNESMLRSWKYGLGIDIRCGIQVAQSQYGNLTQLQMSELFYAGVKVSEQRFELSQNSRTRRVTLTPTVPLGCEENTTIEVSLRSCQVDVQMVDPNSDHSCQQTLLAITSNQKLCGVTLNGFLHSSVDPCLKNFDASCAQGRRMEMEIAVTNDILTYRPDKTFTMMIKTPNVTTHDIWRDSNIANIQVVYKGGSGIWQGKQCEISHDPWVRPFDAYWYIYIHNSLNIGDFLLYKNTRFDSVIHVRSKGCSHDLTGSCTCAVAVQGGGDVFVINVCNNVKQIFYSHCRSNVLSVKTVGQTIYNVYYPTGTYVKIEIYKYETIQSYINVYIYPSPSDVNSIEGLCGNLNGNMDDENIGNDDAFYRRWRITTSYFNTPNPQLPSRWAQEHNFCICPLVDQVTRAPGDDELYSRAFCYDQPYATCNQNLTTYDELKTCSIRQKRSIDRHTENIRRRYEIAKAEDLDYERFRRVKKSVFSVNLTFDEAYQNCVDVFKTKPAFSIASQLPGGSMNDSLSTCAGDMTKNPDNPGWMENHYSSWTSSVAEEIKRNESFQKENQRIVETFHDKTCPFQCYSNGECVHGSCVCHPGFVGDYCLINRSEGLQIADIEGGGLCDLALGDDCHECLEFHTDNLMTDFHCNISVQQAGVDEGLKKLGEETTTGQYENIFQGECCPTGMHTRMRREANQNDSEPFIIQYSISVSNDGVHYGPKKDVYVYDSTCQEYVVMGNGDWLFSLKENTCFINGKCYVAEYESPITACNKCLPKREKYRWTTECRSGTHNSHEDGDDADTKSSGTLTYVVIAVTVGGIFIFACIVVFAMWTYKFKQRSVTAVNAPNAYATCEPMHSKFENKNMKFDNKNVKFDNCGNSSVDIFMTDYEHLRH